MGQVLRGDREHGEWLCCLGNASSDPPPGGLRDGLFQAYFQTASLAVRLAGSGEGNNSAFESSPTLSSPCRDGLCVPESAGAVKPGAEASSGFFRGWEKQAPAAQGGLVCHLGCTRPPLGAAPKPSSHPMAPTATLRGGGLAPGRGVTDRTWSRSSTRASW